jgi:hypothetical protein
LKLIGERASLRDATSFIPSVWLPLVSTRTCCGASIEVATGLFHIKSQDNDVDVPLFLPAIVHRVNIFDIFKTFIDLSYK